MGSGRRPGQSVTRCYGQRHPQPLCYISWIRDAGPFGAPISRVGRRSLSSAPTVSPSNFKAIWWGTAASCAPCCPLLWVAADIAARLHLLDSRHSALRPRPFRGWGASLSRATSRQCGGERRCPGRRVTHCCGQRLPEPCCYISRIRDAGPFGAPIWRVGHFRVRYCFAYNF